MTPRRDQLLARAAARLAAIDEQLIADERPRRRRRKPQDGDPYSGLRLERQATIEAIEDLEAGTFSPAVASLLQTGERR